MNIDINQLMAATGAARANASRKLQPLNIAMAAYAIDTPQRVAMFLANVGHETLGLVYAREIWGPTPAQVGYEGRADLGNVRPGDGKRFLGRGDLQTTGRGNYVRLSERLRARGIACPDFEAEPQALETDQWASFSAADYVDMRGLNRHADAGDFLAYSIGVNGRNKRTNLPNGWEHRKALFDAARSALA
ncbi:MAG TPA: glycoside hydrolase family 19 protein [Burkholderiaceae bacterium]|nr:glycoside hydrolase family 19 protein [Burkholderiaceae bacterium]